MKLFPTLIKNFFVIKRISRNHVSCDDDQIRLYFLDYSIDRLKGFGIPDLVKGFVLF